MACQGGEAKAKTNAKDAKESAKVAMENVGFAVVLGWLGAQSFELLSLEVVER